MEWIYSKPYNIYLKNEKFYYLLMIFLFYKCSFRLKKGQYCIFKLIKNLKLLKYTKLKEFNHLQ
jgi:hypothetical protein